MTDYYDAWSANKRKKNRSRRVTVNTTLDHYNSFLLPNSHQHQHQHVPNRPHNANTTPPSLPSKADARDDAPLPLLTRTTPSSPINCTNNGIAGFSLAKFSPALPRSFAWSHRFSSSAATGDIEKGSPNQTRPARTSIWRLGNTTALPIPSDSIARYDFSPAFDKDYDDDNNDNDDDDDDDDEDDGDNIDYEDNTKDLQYVEQISLHIAKRYPFSTRNTRHRAATGDQASASSAQHRSMFWIDQQRQQQQQQQQQHNRRLVPPAQTPKTESAIEQLVGQDETTQPALHTKADCNSEASSPQAQCSPTLSQRSPRNPSSPFNTHLHPQAHTHAQPDMASPGQSATVNRRDGRRRRPWSQVIWESPNLDEPSPETVTSKHHQHVYDHAATFNGIKDDSYPVLSKDLFTQSATPDPATSNISKTVRITIDSPHHESNPQHQGSLPRRPVRTPERAGAGHSSLLPIAGAGRREFSHSRKHTNRLSIGSAFYASIEPVSLSAATPTTPKTKRQLVRLPARPQSVLIPASAAAVVAGNANLSGQRHCTLQTLEESSTHRRRHQSQQIESGGSTCVASGSGKGNIHSNVGGNRPNLAVPIPWQHLARMGAEDSARTFHGIGSVASAMTPVKTVQQILLETSSSCSALEDSSPSCENRCNALVNVTPPPPQQQQQQPQQQQQQQQTRQLLMPQPATPRHVQPPPSSRFLPTLLESSSFIFQKLSSASSSLSSSNASPPLPSLHVKPTSYTPPTLTPLRTRRMMTTPRTTSLLEKQMNHTLGINVAASNSINSGKNSPTASSPWQKSNSVLLFPLSPTYESGTTLGNGMKQIGTVVYSHANAGSNMASTSSSSVITPAGSSLSPPPPVATAMSTGLLETLPSAHGLSPLAGTVPTISLTPSSVGSTEAFSPESSAASLQRNTRSDNDSGMNEGGQRQELPRYQLHDTSPDHHPSMPQVFKNEGGGEGDDRFPSTDKQMYEESDEYYEICEAQKSHVAVYEINARWGSRLVMFLFALGGIVCSVSGGFCVEYNCSDLQLCPVDHVAHGNWCGPSEIDQFF
ncbi:hypothetical protein BGZ94_000428 [Podila epigama]|nr:hypothetical protein BGZ94_000428 [Podila epigama]